MGSELDTPGIVSEKRKEDQDSFKPINNNPGVMSQDLGKKIRGLEYAIEELKRSATSASDIKEIKDSFSNLSDIKNKLREMEDLDLITRMETIKAEDDIHILTESMESLKSKMELLSGAIKIMGTKLGKDGRCASPEMRREYLDAEKDITSLKYELDTIKKNLDTPKGIDYSEKISALEQKYKEIDARLKAGSSGNTGQRAPTAPPEEDAGTMKEYRKEPQHIADTGSMDSKTLANIKYIPLLKENISKLYNAYNTTEKKICDIEKTISHLHSEKITLPGGAQVDLDETIKKSVESELSGVLENIDSLTSEIKSRIDDESIKQQTIIDALKQEHSSQISAIAGFDTRLQRLEQTRPYNYEEFAEFKARVLADIEDLKKSARNISTKMSEHVENMVDNKIMPHVSTQNKIAETVSILNRKVEEKHLEISKNTHEKVDRTTRQIMEKIAELENDVTLLKDMRVDIVEDMTLILERFEKDAGRSPAISGEIEGKYDKKLDDLSREIETLKTRDTSLDESDIREVHALRELVHAVRNENDILKVELDKIKRFYMDLLRREEETPVIIE